MNLSKSSDWKTLVQDLFWTVEWIIFRKILHLLLNDLLCSTYRSWRNACICSNHCRRFSYLFPTRSVHTHEGIRSQLYIQIKCVRLRPSVSQEYRDRRWLKRISRSRALIDSIEDQLRFTPRNFQYNHDVNRSEGTRSCEINMNGRTNDIDSVRWRVSVVICIVFEEHRYADVLLIVTLRIYSSVLALIRRTSSVCLTEMMSIRKESLMSTWTLRDRWTPSCPWSRSSGICDPLSAFHSRGLVGRFTNSRSRVKFEWSDLRESTDRQRKFSR